MIRARGMDRLWAMEVFVKVVEAGSMSRAATHLDLANASVTSCIRNLETHIGATLLQRSTRHIRLTDEGARFYARCRDILAMVDEAEADASPTEADLRGVLRVEMPIALGHLIIGPALTGFAAEHPKLRIVVNLTNSVDDLIRRAVDIAIRIDEVDDIDLVARRIYETRHVLCAAPDFLTRHGQPSGPAQIDPAHCIGLSMSLTGKPKAWTFYRDGESHVIEPAGNLSFNSSDALLRSAAQGGGFVYVLDILAHDYLSRGELLPVLPDWTTASQSFFAVYPPSRYVPKRVKLFVAFVANLLKQV
ncbi:MAG: LysR family transcriptional regulator [Janthinobacterium lividum]